MPPSQERGSTDVEKRLNRFERRNHRLRLAVLALATGFVGIATAAFLPSRGTDQETLRARAIVLVDSAGESAAHIRWTGGELQFIIPSPAPQEHRMEADGLRVVTPTEGKGGQIVLRPGPPGPSLLLADGDGNEVLTLGHPAVRPAR